MNTAATLTIMTKAMGVMEAQKGFRALDDQLHKTSKSGTAMSGAFKKVGAVVGGVVAFDTLKRGVGAAVSEFEEARKVGAQTQNVIKTTGGAANVTAKHVAALAGAISKTAGVDDELIQKGANLLLTFTNVRNEAGRGSKIFDRATKAAVDLSAAGFGSIESASKGLGKALNDPVRGISALNKSGVTFTDQQKKQIATLVESGKSLKAQKIIMREVERQVKGSAAAQATSFDKLKVTLGNVAEAAGAVLVPAFDKVASFAAKFLNQLIEGKATGGAIISVFKDVGGAIGTIVSAVKNVVGWFKQHETVTLALAAAIGVVLAAFVGFKILAAVQAAIVAVRGAMLALNAAFLTNPVVLVVAGLAALVAGLVVAYRESETFRKIIDGAWAVIKDVAGWLISAGVAAFNAVKDAVAAAWGAVKGATETVWPAIKAVLVGVWGAIKTVVTTYFEGYKTLILGVWRVVRDTTTTIWNVLKTVLGTVWAGLKTGATTIFEAIRTVILTAFRVVRDTGGAIWAGIKDALSTVWDSIKGVAESLWNGIKRVIVNPIREAVDAVRGALGSDGLLGWIRERIDDFTSAATKITKPLIDGFNAVKNAVDDVIGVLEDIGGVAKDAAGIIGKLSFGAIGGGGNQPGAGYRGSMPAHVSGFDDDASTFGLTMTSGQRYDPGSYHHLNRARDYSNGTGPTAQMMAFARYMVANFGSRLTELFYSPLGGSIKNGQWIPGMIIGGGPGTPGNHYNHVHVALANGGKILRDGWALVGEKGPELAHFPAGASVYSNSDSRGMLSSGGPVTLHAVIDLGRGIKERVRLEFDDQGRQLFGAYRAGVAR